MLWNTPQEAAASNEGFKEDPEQHFTQAARQASASIASGTDSTVIGHHGLMLGSWRQFMSRWLSRAAAEDDVRPF